MSLAPATLAASIAVAVLSGFVIGFCLALTGPKHPAPQGASEEK